MALHVAFQEANIHNIPNSILFLILSQINPAVHKYDLYVISSDSAVRIIEGSDYRVF
jgi:hypothetical protein